MWQRFINPLPYFSYTLPTTGYHFTKISQQINKSWEQILLLKPYLYWTIKNNNKKIQMCVMCGDQFFFSLLVLNFLHVCTKILFICLYLGFFSPVSLIEWPTLSDQPTGCNRGLCLWHQKSESTSPEDPSPPSSYSSLMRPPMTVSTTAKRVRLTWERSTTSTRTPCLNGHLKLSAIWNTDRWETEDNSYAEMKEKQME